MQINTSALPKLFVMGLFVNTIGGASCGLRSQCSISCSGTMTTGQSTSSIVGCTCTLSCQESCETCGHCVVKSHMQTC